MTQPRQQLTRRLLSLAAAATLLGGCAAAPVATIVPAAPIAADAHAGHDAHGADAGLRFLTVNVELSDEGISPAMVAIPAGREIKLVVRNRGMTEHHYQVRGLVPHDLWRVSTAEASATRDSNAPLAAADGEHDEHNHSASLGAYVSQAGVIPSEHEVHAFAQGGGGGMDVIFFTATTPGTYEVRCTLHPTMVAKLMVF
jgi:plastocyanin